MKIPCLFERCNLCLVSVDVPGEQDHFILLSLRPVVIDCRVGFKSTLRGSRPGSAFYANHDRIPTRTQDLSIESCPVKRQLTSPYARCRSSAEWFAFGNCASTRGDRRITPHLYTIVSAPFLFKWNLRQVRFLVAPQKLISFSKHSLIML
jgi:hypothetical protein